MAMIFELCVKNGFRICSQTLSFFAPIFVTLRNEDNLFKFPSMYRNSGQLESTGGKFISSISIDKSWVGIFNMIQK